MPDKLVRLLKPHRHGTIDYPAWKVIPLPERIADWLIAQKYADEQTDLPAGAPAPALLRARPRPCCGQK